MPLPEEPRERRHNRMFRKIAIPACAFMLLVDLAMGNYVWAAVLG